MRLLRSLFAVCALLLLGFSALPAHAASGTELPGSSLYPRVLRIEHGAPAANGHLLASTDQRIFESDDEGAHWQSLGKVPIKPGSVHLCCSTLYEMPRTVGALAAGTLISAASNKAAADGTPDIELYISTDEGHSWQYYDTPVVRGPGLLKGLWEPEFEIAADGALVMFWSDETDPCCSQKLAQMRTYDGKRWQDKTDTVHRPNPRARPGMITVSRLPNGHYFMSYEVCGPAKCQVFSRSSPDGWNFGNPADIGTRVTDGRGQYYEHAPLNHWIPLPGNPDGAVVLVAQVLYDANGSVAAQNGQVVMINPEPESKKPWRALPAPVSVPDAHDNYCPNYSSALLPVEHGSQLLELASDYVGKRCTTFYARAPLAP